MDTYCIFSYLKNYATLFMFGFDASKGSPGSLSTSLTMNPYFIIADVLKCKRTPHTTV